MYKVSGKRARRIIRGFVFDIDIEEKFEWRIILKCTYYYTAANKFVRICFVLSRENHLFYGLYKTYLVACNSVL